MAEMKARILILAASSQNGGRCVAGKTIDDKCWIRPVGDAGALPVNRLRLSDGETAEVGDIVDIHFQNDDPQIGPKTAHQIENRLLANSEWQKVSRVRYGDLGEYADHPNTLWQNGKDSGLGQNNGIPAPIAVSGSLLLIRVRDVQVVWKHNPYSNSGKKQPYAQFQWKATEHSLRLTDCRPSNLCPWRRGNFSFPECFLCISLTGEYYNLHVKLAACIIEPERLP